MIRRTRSERGAISAMLVTLIVMLFVLAGLVVDGGFAINARQKIYDDAEQAARAAANQIDIETLRATGEIVILEGQALLFSAAVRAEAARSANCSERPARTSGLSLDRKSVV